MKLLKVISLLCFTALFTQNSFAQKPAIAQPGTMQKIDNPTKKKASSSSKAKRKAYNIVMQSCEKGLLSSFRKLDEQQAKELKSGGLNKMEVNDLKKEYSKRKEDLMDECILAKMQEMGY